MTKVIDIKEHYVKRKGTDEGSNGMRICRRDGCHAKGEPQDLIECFPKNPQQHLGRHIYCRRCLSKIRSDYHKRCIKKRELEKEKNSICNTFYIDKNGKS